jgi:ABC-type antimicrobial peptide transport system permease subunit
VVIVQAFLSLFIGFALAIGLVELMGLVLPQFIAGFNLALTGQSIVRVLVASLVIGVVAVSIPTWQMARLDPAQVFRN